MKKNSLCKKTIDQIESAVAYYRDGPYQAQFQMLADTLLRNLTESGKLGPLIHLTKARVKDPEHLRDKLQRKALEAAEAGKDFEINNSNLFTKIEDLAGVRLLHLYTRQMESIHPAIIEVLKEHRYRLVGHPVAYTWDIESQEFFNGIDIRTVLRPSMYTSVHYVVKANRVTDMRCELQVRTLVEEVWGEVSHSINYPHETDNEVCKVQLGVLARLASGFSRLVDSIFLSYRVRK